MVCIKKKEQNVEGERRHPLEQKDNVNKKKNQKMSQNLFVSSAFTLPFFTFTWVLVCMGRTYVQTLMVCPIHEQTFGSWCLPNDGFVVPFW